MIPRIFFDIDDDNDIYIKYKTKEEFWQIKNILEKFGFKRYTCSGTRYPKGGVFCVRYHKILRPKNQYLLYYLSTSDHKNIDKSYTLQDLLNLL